MIYYRSTVDPVGIAAQVGSTDVFSFTTFEAQQFIAKVRDGDVIVFDHPLFPSAVQVLGIDHYTGSVCAVWVDVPPDERPAAQPEVSPTVARIFDVARNLDALR